LASKYDRLTQHLNSISSNVREVTITFKELEGILGFVLPKSAVEYRQWWENPKESKGRSQAQAWIEAGFKVDSVRLQKPGGWASFIRK